MKFLTIISGVPASMSIGAGRLVQHLITESYTYGPNSSIVFGGNKSAAAAALRSKRYFAFTVAVLWHYLLRAVLWMRLPFLINRDRVVLVHFQEIGSRWCGFFINARTKPIWIYILDASFFCIRSYNHLPGEASECLRCCGGGFENAAANNCKPFPIRDGRSIPFLEILKREAATGKLRFIAQNEGHAKLLQRHFGKDAIVKTAGLWTVDMGDMPVSRKQSDTQEETYDVVFHADAKDAKGFPWMLQLAVACPELRFLFPFAMPAHGCFPVNCHFRPMRWESGLREMIASSPMTMAPSLWSAPIEGALVKSILHAPRVAVPIIATAFSAEIPESLVAHLPLDPVVAANHVRHRLSQPPNDPMEVHLWIARLRRNARLLERMAVILDADP